MISSMASSMESAVAVVSLLLLALVAMTSGSLLSCMQELGFVGCVVAVLLLSVCV